MSVISGVLSVLFLICLAGIVYPFKPFKSRKWAFLSSIIAFIAMLFQFGIYTTSPKFQAELETEASTAVREATSAMEAGEYTRAENILDAVSDIAADKKPEEFSALRIVIAKTQAIIGIQKIIEQTETDTEEKLKQILNVWRGLNRIPDTQKALAPELEPLLLSLIKPVPASDRTTNRLGYELLGEVNEYSNIPTDEYRAKARQYAVSNLTPDTPVASCEVSNYKFIYQVKLQLRDPGSLKPGRVYKGQKRGDSTQYVYMDSHLHRRRNNYKLASRGSHHKTVYDHCEKDR